MPITKSELATIEDKLAKLPLTASEASVVWYAFRLSEVEMNRARFTSASARTIIGLAKRLLEKYAKA